MQRRNFLIALSGASVILATRSFATPFAAGAKVSIVKFSDDGKMLGHAILAKMHKDAEWRKVLSPLAYQVTREQGTEQPFIQPGYDRHDPGLYRCVCCDNALFNANTKFDSHTGWPSFWQAIASENVREISDHMLGMVRTEVKCTLCESHLGHVFDDGPNPTGLRYCMNAVAMRFVPINKGA